MYRTLCNNRSTFRWWFIILIEKNLCEKGDYDIFSICHVPYQERLYRYQSLFLFCQKFPQWNRAGFMRKAKSRYFPRVSLSLTLPRQPTFRYLLASTRGRWWSDRLVRNRCTMCRISCRQSRVMLSWSFTLGARTALIRLRGLRSEVSTRVVIY